MKRALIVLALCALGCETRTEKGDPPKAVGRFELESGWLSHLEVSAVCDTKTGNLLYLYGAGYNGAIAVVQNGCAAK